MIYIIGTVALLALIVAVKSKIDHISFKDEQNKIIADLKAEVQKLRGK